MFFLWYLHFAFYWSWHFFLKSVARFEKRHTFREEKVLFRPILYIILISYDYPLTLMVFWLSGIQKIIPTGIWIGLNTDFVSELTQMSMVLTFHSVGRSARNLYTPFPSGFICPIGISGLFHFLEKCLQKVKKSGNPNQTYKSGRKCIKTAFI